MNIHKISLLFFLALLAINIAHAENTDQNLSTLQTQIQHVQQDLKAQKMSRAQLQEKLKQTETQLGDMTQREKKTATEQKKQQAALHALKKQQAELEKKLIAQKDALALEMRAAYMLDQKEYLRLLLNQEDPTNIDRDLTYYQYIARYQLSVIDQLNQLTQQLAENSQTILERTDKLTALQNQQKQQLAEIKNVQVEREAALKELSTEIQSKNDQLRELLADRAALEQVVKKVEAEKTTVGGEISWPTGTSFAASKGKLHWPTRGRILAGFNTPIEQSETKLDAVLLGASEGQEIHAIAPGRVAFAEWMSGYGLLMIIDHGQGYMTLYGRNGSLFKQVGDTVSAGERIGTVGKTGGYAEPGLYFAIRKQGEPLNPQVWCR